jgi:hypothetical protein
MGNMAKLLDVQSFTKKFGGLFAVYDLSFHVDEGESLGLIGPNGSAAGTGLFELYPLAQSVGGVRILLQDSVERSTRCLTLAQTGKREAELEKGVRSFGAFWIGLVPGEKRICSFAKLSPYKKALTQPILGVRRQSIVRIRRQELAKSELCGAIITVENAVVSTIVVGTRIASRCNRGEFGTRL